MILTPRFPRWRGLCVPDDTAFRLRHPIFCCMSLLFAEILAFFFSGRMEILHPIYNQR
jgi:hypothetical protein